MLKSNSLSSFYRLIYRHVLASILSSFRISRIQLLGTILVLLLTIWWPSQRVVNHLPDLLELIITLFPGFHSILSVKRGAWSFLWKKTHIQFGRYETDTTNGGFIGKYWWYRSFDIWGSWECVFRFFTERCHLIDVHNRYWIHWLCCPCSFPRFQDILQHHIRWDTWDVPTMENRYWWWSPSLHRRAGCKELTCHNERYYPFNW